MSVVRIMLRAFASSPVRATPVHGFPMRHAFDSRTHSPVDGRRKANEICTHEEHATHAPLPFSRVLATQAQPKAVAPLRKTGVPSRCALSLSCRGRATLPI